MNKKILVLLPVAALIADVVLANIPGPIPTPEAVFNAEHDSAFLSLTRIVINGSLVNGTYYYMGYSNDPSRDFFCVHNLYEMWLHYLNPFHQYTTTTLVFAVTFQTHPEPPYSLYGINLFLQVNPTTGHIYNTKESPQCAGPPPPPQDTYDWMNDRNFSDDERTGWTVSGTSEKSLNLSVLSAPVGWP